MFFNYKTEMQLPKTWEPMFINENLRKVQLKVNSSEYSAVLHNVKATDQSMTGDRIIKVGLMIKLHITLLHSDFFFPVIFINFSNTPCYFRILLYNMFTLVLFTDNFF